MPRPRPSYRPVLVVFVCATLAACGGGGGGGGTPPSPPPPPPPPTFSVGGTVSGLDAVGLVLQNNAGPDLTITGNGTFTFPAQLTTGGAYAVTIKTQPSIGPIQACSLTNGSGTVASSAITNVAITCVSLVFKFLYVTSTFANDLRGYSIDAATGTLTALTWPPIATGIAPTFPIAAPSGKFVYLTTRGSTVDPPRVEVFAADAATGALSRVGFPYDLHTPPPPANQPFVSGTSIHPSGAFGYVSVPLPSSQLYGATINATTGELTEIPGMPIAIGASLTGIAFDSTGGFMFASTNTPAGGPGEIRSFSVNVPSGVLTPIGPGFPTSGNGATGVFLMPGGDYLMTTNVNSGTLVVFAVNKTAGTLTPVGQPVPTGPAGSAPVGIVLNRRNNVFYTLNRNAPGSLAAFRFDFTTGAVTPVGAPVSANGALGNVLLHSSGRFLFQFNATTSSIQRYTLDQTTGAPTLGTDVATLAGTQSINFFLDVSGKYAYVTNPAATVISSYSIDAATGAFAPISSLPTSPGSQATVPYQLQ